MVPPEDDSDLVDREAILARRKRFVAAALTGLTTSTLATACPCLNVAGPETDTDPDGSGTAGETHDGGSTATGGQTTEASTGTSTGGTSTGASTGDSSGG